MKKIILFISAAAMLLASCAEKEAFTITGKAPNGKYDGQQVFLQTLAPNWKDKVTIDTANIVDGQFIFKGLAKEGPTVHFVVLDNSPEFVKPALVVVEAGDIKLSLDTINTVEGTSLNNSYQLFASTLQDLNLQRRLLGERAKADTTSANIKVLKEESKQLTDKAKEATFNFVKANIGNQLGAYFLANRSYMFSLDQMKELSANVKPEYKTSESIQKIDARIAILDATSIGKVYTDLKGKTPEGKDAALSDYVGKGKYVLVDFWASWCSPCKEETPELVKLYAAYKNKGLEIVGISLDDDNAKWIAGIKELKITWPQISDLKKWDSALSAAYGVNSIPHLVLLDKDGKILERGLTAGQASEKIAGLLK
ncbi:TlpA disulfide reductase family protein [Dysgonomonas sp. 511]|uniref:TlpA disulfide reductase family protein n=1 Tax=Dysgonomonas sp. 511 TaxID=2302930 RepID=UPI0013D40068|nr:TlpA disulfide reductase family protein [Dysgonomonas sp. 511]NDV77508.1 AhpC/TSA family protein [Dysgonomonas sp. 511]